MSQKKVSKFELTDEQIYFLFSCVSEQFNRKLSYHWFYLGIVIGVFGNLATSILLDFIRFRAGELWSNSLKYIGAFSVILVLYIFTKAYFDSVREHQKWKAMIDYFPLEELAWKVTPRKVDDE